jgi:RES domain-containing protein
MELWRISNYKSLQGEGSFRASGRWHTAGHRIVYLAETPAGALLEILVHLDLMGAPLPANYTLLRITCSQTIEVTDLVTRTSGDTWKQPVDRSQAIGNAWLEEGTSALAWVPSSILPNTSNYLLNPLHDDAAKFAITEVMLAEFDKRLLRNLRSKLT